MSITEKLIQETAAGNSWRQRETELLRNRALRLYAAEPAHNIKRARVECYLMEHITVEIGPNELLAGRLPVDCPFSPDEEKAFQEETAYAKSVGSINGIDSGATYHRVLDYEKVLKIGISGILQEIAGRQAAIDVTQPDAVERAVVYKAAEIALKGAVILAERYRQMLADLAAATSDVARAEELRTLAGILARVPEQPARSFHEALQSMWLIQFCACLIGDISLTGRPDNYLYPYYRHDIETGALTPEFALELIEQLYCKKNQIYGAWPASLMVGGVDRDGDPNWNELSYLFIRAIEATRLINPSVAVCYNEAMPADLLQLCVKIIARGLTKPAFFNDRLVTEGLVRAGVTLEDARQYIHSTCVEITPIAASNIFVATPYINLCKAFEYLFHDGRKIYGDEAAVEQVTATDLSELKTFELFYRRYKEIAAAIIRNQLQRVNRDIYLKTRYASCPFSSALIRDCLERGKDAVNGGARYNFVYPCFPGFVNAVDSLAAVKKAVYEEKTMTLNDIHTMIGENFRDYEKERLYLLNRCAKFGNDLPEADAIADDFYRFIYDELSRYRTCLGGTFHPSYFAWIMHGEFGKKSAATPDGRLAGTALSECLGAAQGRDRNGPTAVMRSISRIDQSLSIGGIATNFRFTKSLLAGKAGQAALASFIRAFFAGGNFECQFNAVDQKDLLDAQKNPENYRSLQVRVAGYSDYFVNLDPVIQNEVILRTEHDTL